MNKDNYCSLEMSKKLVDSVSYPTDKSGGLKEP